MTNNISYTNEPSFLLYESLINRLASTEQVVNPPPPFKALYPSDENYALYYFLFFKNLPITAREKELITEELHFFSLEDKVIFEIKLDPQNIPPFIQAFSTSPSVFNPLRNSSNLILPSFALLKIYFKYANTSCRFNLEPVLTEFSEENFSSKKAQFSIPIYFNSSNTHSWESFLDASKSLSLPWKVSTAFRRLLYILFKEKQAERHTVSYLSFTHLLSHFSFSNPIFSFRDFFYSKEATDFFLENRTYKECILEEIALYADLWESLLEIDGSQLNTYFSIEDASFILSHRIFNTPLALDPHALENVLHLPPIFTTARKSDTLSYGYRYSDFIFIHLAQAWHLSLTKEKDIHGFQAFIQLRACYKELLGPKVIRAPIQVCLLFCSLMTLPQDRFEIFLEFFKHKNLEDTHLLEVVSFMNAVSDKKIESIHRDVFFGICTFMLENRLVSSSPLLKLPFFSFALLPKYFDSVTLEILDTIYFFDFKEFQNHAPLFLSLEYPEDTSMECFFYSIDGVSFNLFSNLNPTCSDAILTELSKIDSINETEPLYEVFYRIGLSVLKN